jgi:tetratricopeptide (TPR) repeat protein
MGEDEPSFWLSTVLTIAPLLVLFYLAWRLWALLWPAVALTRGDYAAARRGFERTTRSWLPSTSRASRYNVAFCLELEGRLAEAEARIRKLLEEPLDDRLTYASKSLLGTILVLREHQHDEARVLLDAAQREIPTPLVALILAHAHLSLGDRGGAAQHAASAMIMPPPPHRVGWKAALRFDPKLQASMEAFFRGWYFYRVGEMQRARAELEIAARSPLPHVCTQRARALLPQASRPSIDEEPSSLSPHEFP